MGFSRSHNFFQFSRTPKLENKTNPMSTPFSENYGYAYVRSTAALLHKLRNFH